MVDDVEILLPVNFVEFRSAVPRFQKLKTFQPIRGQGSHLPIGSKKQTWYKTLRSCFLSSFVGFRLAVSEEKLKMFQPIRGQGYHLVFPIGQKNTNLVENIKILLTDKFH